MITGYRMIARSHGGPEVIEREDFEVPAPGPGELLFETEAVGLNFIDTYYRKGLYPDPLPIQLGSESVGKVLAVGPGVEGFQIGDRVGCCLGNNGAYATHRVIAAARALPIPQGVAASTAAAVMLKGLTACYLAEDTFPAKAGDIALVHSAAGGVGSLLVPWLRDKGVTVIAHVGSSQKADGIVADHILHCNFNDLDKEVKAATQGVMCHVVYDGVGHDSWQASLSCLRPRGLMVSFGNASGAVKHIAALDLMRAGSLYLTRPTLGDYVGTPETLRQASTKLFERIASGVLDPKVGQTFALQDAARAHRALEGRRTTGSTVLVP